MAKEINTRIMLKHDSLTNWNESSLVLKPGEVGVAYVDVTTKDAKGNIIHVPTALMKVGENVEGSTKTFKDLPFMSALAADVYSWAKEQSLYVEVVGEGEAVANVEFKTTEAHPNGAIVITKIDLVTPAELATALTSYYTKTEVDGIVAGYYKKGEVDKLLEDLGVSGLGDRIGAVEETIEGYGDIVTHNVAEFATAAQGATADTTAATIATYGDIVTHNASEFATVTNVNTELAKKADTTYVDGELAKKQDVIPEGTYDAYGSAAAVEAKLADYTKTKDLPTDLGDFTNNAGYAKTADVNTELNKKADKTQVATDIANAIAPLATTEALNGVDAKFANYTTTTDMNAKFDLKADKSVVDAMYTNTQIDGFIAAEKERAESIESGLRTDVDAIKGDYLKTADKTALQEQITANANAITTLTDGIDPDKIDGLTDLVNWANTHAPEVESIKSDIEANAKAIADQATSDAATYATKTELGNVDAKFANYKTAEAQKAIDDEQDRRLDVIEGDYLKAADIANFETKENVKKVADDLAAYETANDAALDVVRTNAQKGVDDAAAAQETIDNYVEAHANDYTNTQIDNAIDADVSAAIEAEVNRADGKYEEKGVAATLDAALKAELEKTIADGDADTLEAAKTDASNKDAVVLAESQKYTDNKITEARTAISAEIDADVKVVQDVIDANKATWDKAGTALQAADLADYAKSADVETTYRRKDTKITSEDLSDEVFVFNCGTATTVI